MKRTYITILISCFSIFLNKSISAVGPLNPMPLVYFEHNYDVTPYDIPCHGGIVGITPLISGGAPPYTYKWYNSSGTLIATTLSLPPSMAGTYTIYLYSGSNNSSWNVTLTEPSAMSITFSKSSYTGGFNVSYYGGHDGSIDCIVQGGIPSYSYQWSNGSPYEINGNLSAGTYSVTVTDENGCIATSSPTTLTAPTALVVSLTSPTHQGKNVSCNGGNDGAINLTVSGGVSPYSYNWGGGVYTQNRTGLTATTYTVIVDDANPGARDTVSITLNQPSLIAIALSSPLFSNGFNTSCYNCKDGRINSDVSGGISPYTYLWNNSLTNTYIDTLKKGIDTVTVTDNNGCKMKKSYEVTGDIEGWKIGGNTNIDTSKQFVGTKDSIDVILKTNGKKMMTVKANGMIEMNAPLKISHSTNTNTNDYRAVYATSDGTIDFVGGNSVFIDPCQSYPVNPWFFIKSTCNGYNTNDIFLDNNFRNVGIGTILPSTKLDVVGGIKSSDLAGTSGFNIVNTGTDGKLTSLHPPTSIANQYLLNGTGTWGLSNWLASGSNIFSNPSNAKVGIATSVPKEYLQIGNQFTFHGDDYNSIIGHNYYYKDLGSGSYTDAHIISGPSSRLCFGGEGDILLQTATTGNAESAISSWNTGLKITNDGNVSIGTLQHDKLLTVNGDVQFLTSTIGNNHNALQILSGANLPERRGINIPDESGAADFNFFIHEYNGTAAFNFCKRKGDNPNTDVEKLMQIRKDGKVGIGIEPSEKLDVDGNVLVRGTLLLNGNSGSSKVLQIKNTVDQSNNFEIFADGSIYGRTLKLTVNVLPPDYVFQNGYSLISLKDLAKFIRINKHLPNIPSASELLDEGHIDIGNMQLELLKKIEELTLYVIKQDEQIQNLQNKINNLPK